VHPIPEDIKDSLAFQTFNPESPDRCDVSQDDDDQEEQLSLKLDCSPAVPNMNMSKRESVDLGTDRVRQLIQAILDLQLSKKESTVEERRTCDAQIERLMREFVRMVKEERPKLGLKELIRASFVVGMAKTEVNKDL